MTEFQTFWKQHAAKKQTTSADMAALALYRASKKEDKLGSARHFLKASFKPIISATKLANGAYADYALWEALFYLGKSESFKHLTDDEKGEVMELSKSFCGSYGRIKW